MKTVNRDPVQDYILENEDNLRIAAAVSDAWPQAGEKLVQDFLDRLRSRLEKELKGWQFDRWGRCLTDSNVGFYFWKSAWKEEYYVILQFFDQGQDLRFGLQRDENQEHIKKRPPIPEPVTRPQETIPNHTQ